MGKTSKLPSMYNSGSLIEILKKKKRLVVNLPTGNLRGWGHKEGNIESVVPEIRIYGATDIPIQYLGGGRTEYSELLQDTNNHK